MRGAENEEEEREEEERRPYDVVEADQVLETLATKFKREDADQTVVSPVEQPKRREKRKQVRKLACADSFS